MVVDTVRDGNEVVMMNVAFRAPAGIVTVGGRLAKGLPVAFGSLLNVTTTPPSGAGCSRMTRPRTSPPPTMRLGVSVKATRVGIGGVTKTCRDVVIAFGTAGVEAVIVTFWLELTTVVVPTNVAVRFGAVMRTEDGNDNTVGRLDVSVIKRLELGASFNETVPETFWNPPTTLV